MMHPKPKERSSCTNLLVMVKECRNNKFRTCSDVEHSGIGESSLKDSLVDNPDGHSQSVGLQRKSRNKVKHEKTCAQKCCIVL